MNSTPSYLRLNGPRWLARLAAIALTTTALATDPPHDASSSITCSTCHINPAVPAATIETLAGNPNLCLSCHQPGGSAGAKALFQGDQARPWPGLPAGTSPGGTSHRWDSGTAGRAVFLGDPAFNGDAGISISGTYTGIYAKTFIITITTNGGSTTAQFDWSATWPGGSSGGTNWTAAKSLPFTDGLTLSFINWRPPPAYRAGDQWQILVRPGLNPPTNPNLVLQLQANRLVCSTCHNQHEQAMTPFDPKAPDYPTPGTGAGRHFMRMDAPQDELCQECHRDRFVTNAIAGSHVVGVLVGSNALIHPPAALPLDKTEGKMWCSTCHQVHGSPGKDGNILRAATEPALCVQCHQQADVAGAARHLMPLDATLWPGGQYGSLMPAVTDPAQRGSCGNCHRVHGWPDAANPTNSYPTLLAERDINLCYTCHDGSPVSKNLRANFAKPYRHPVTTTGRHNPGEVQPGNYGSTNRHSECVDCHNVHQLAADTYTPVPPYATKALAGVNRVSVQNNATNNITYTFRGAADATPVKEYELCFTCHSGWTTLPTGKPNVAAEFNTKNASFHPVESAGKNLNINAGAFVNGWAATKVMNCSDCHTSDDTTIRGPHGSTNQYILKKKTVASTTRRASGATMASTEECFDCHNFDTYANSGSSSTVKNYSRFSGEEGHVYHVVSRRYSCYNCHDSHGSANLPNLLVTGRSPGINTYTRTTSGGTCNATCHGNESYSVTYPR
jgi:predicted CXXCH cytochrome family protein